jgi:pimeloyl-ACP methyl ester carboxylesterase
MRYKERTVRVPDATREAIAIHQAAGRRFAAGGVNSFVREQPPPVGTGAPVILVHGVPSSSFLYRKMIPALAQQGLRAIAFDFPGLGLADRPADFDYSWSGLARWMGEAIDALEVDRCHLVVHDIGGPIGCEWAVRNPDRVLSLTALNTLLGVADFRRPWTMRPFGIRGVGELWLASLRPFAMSELLYLQAIANRAATPRREVYAYYYLLKRIDGGRAFLRIMRGFELTAEKQRFLWEGLAERPYPARIVWGERDPALGLAQMRLVQEALEVPDPILVPAKHFLQEDQAIAVANAITDLAAPLG